jgi:hypothetical protein
VADSPPTLDAGYAPVGDARAAYETRGVSLVRYLARRTAKTRLLLELPDLLPAEGEARPARALAAFGMYCAAAAASFGRGYRQPTFDPTGTELTEIDPETGARIVARLEGRGPGSRIRLAVDVELPGIGTFEGREEITGTTLGLRGLGMPAPSRFVLRTASPLAPWEATAVGLITAELAPRLGGTLVRGYGSLDLRDDRGTRGTVVLDRTGIATARVDGPDASVVRRSFGR